MSTPAGKCTRFAIACGGTGGHLFPGLAIADELLRQDCAVTLLISTKEVDQQAVRDCAGMDVVSLPSVGLVPGGSLSFLRGFYSSYRVARLEFRQRPPNAVLAMGGFTSAPPVLAGKRRGARVFLHESNAIAGRANRWLSYIVDLAFLAFPSAAARLRTNRIRMTGTPVRSSFGSLGTGMCRLKLGLDPARPVVLVMGGSQGAQAINELIVRLLPEIRRLAPEWQWLHLTGPHAQEEVRTAYENLGLKAVVKAFCSEMDLALGAATGAVSRAGASALAEMARVQVPCVLIPYPAATDKHQHFNARAYAESGAAVLLEQHLATPGSLKTALVPLINDPSARQRMRDALQTWSRPKASQEIVAAMLAAVADPGSLKNPFARKTAFA
jgi:UDP-N-acetylglucosamine--N-acetylmuramyl-(pentapeptide) pyrophosphoryl-undecaprenol N-acetylglucosamine transferase